MAFWSRWTKTCRFITSGLQTPRFPTVWQKKMEKQLSLRWMYHDNRPLLARQSKRFSHFLPQFLLEDPWTEHILSLWPEISMSRRIELCFTESMKRARSLLFLAQHTWVYWIARLWLLARSLGGMAILWNCCRQSPIRSRHMCSSCMTPISTSRGSWRIPMSLCPKIWMSWSTRDGDHVMWATLAYR